MELWFNLEIYNQLESVFGMKKSIYVEIKVALNLLEPPINNVINFYRNVLQMELLVYKWIYVHHILPNLYVRLLLDLMEFVFGNQLQLKIIIELSVKNFIVLIYNKVGQPEFAKLLHRLVFQMEYFVFQKIIVQHIQLRLHAIQVD